MTSVAAFCLASVALLVALLALVAALDAREFWRALLEDYRTAQRPRERVQGPRALVQPERPAWR